MTKPTIEQLKLQCAKLGIPEIEAEKFLNYYESNGWKVGRNAMKSWVHALNNWRLNYESRYRQLGKPNHQRIKDQPIGGRATAILAARKKVQDGAGNRMATKMDQHVSAPPFHSGNGHQGRMVL